MASGIRPAQPAALANSRGAFLVHPGSRCFQRQPPTDNGNQAVKALASLASSRTSPAGYAHVALDLVNVITGGDLGIPAFPAALCLIILFFPADLAVVRPRLIIFPDVVTG